MDRSCNSSLRFWAGLILVGGGVAAAAFLLGIDAEPWAYFFAAIIGVVLLYRWRRPV